MIQVRPEVADDIPAIRRVNELAFAHPSEADLVDALRKDGALAISLVAVDDAGQVVGHIAFSPVNIESSGRTIQALGLAPMAVLPEFQNRGIGGQLVEFGLLICRQKGCELVVLLGYPQYYPRFGFQPSKPHGIRWEHEVPDEVFMVKELVPGALDRTEGVACYHPAFELV